VKTKRVTYRPLKGFPLAGFGGQYERTYKVGSDGSVWTLFCRALFR